MAGANKNTKDPHGNSAILTAAKNGYTKCFDILKAAERVPLAAATSFDGDDLLAIAVDEGVFLVI